MASSTFTGPGGTDPLRYTANILAAANTTVADAAYGGSFLISRIRQRTAAGINVQGVPFAPYTEAYAKRKAKKLGHVGNPDLFGYQQHPHMLNALTTRVGNAVGNSIVPSNEPADAFYIGIYGAADIETRARVHNEGTRPQPQREFLGADGNDMRQLEQRIGQAIDARLKNLE